MVEHACAQPASRCGGGTSSGDTVYDTRVVGKVEFRRKHIYANSGSLAFRLSSEPLDAVSMIARHSKLEATDESTAGTSADTPQSLEVPASVRRHTCGTRSSPHTQLTAHVWHTQLNAHAARPRAASRTPTGERQEPTGQHRAARAPASALPQRHLQSLTCNLRWAAQGATTRLSTRCSERIWVWLLWVLSFCGRQAPKDEDLMLAEAERRNIHDPSNMMAGSLDVGQLPLIDWHNVLDDENLLGKGGFSSVYKVQLGGIDMAFKIFRKYDPRTMKVRDYNLGLKEFNKEADILPSLQNHPGIVDMFHYGEAPDGQLASRLETASAHRPRSSHQRPPEATRGHQEPWLLPGFYGRRAARSSRTFLPSTRTGPSSCSNASSPSSSSIPTRRSGTCGQTAGTGRCRSPCSSASSRARMCIRSLS